MIFGGGFTNILCFFFQALKDCETLFMAIIMHLSKKKLWELMASNKKEDHTYITPEGVIQLRELCI